MAPSAYQASAPSSSKAARMRAFTAGSRRRKSGSSGLAPRRVKQVSGTPQARWRESTQSGRCESMAWSRLRPERGVKATNSSVERRARSRMVAPCASSPSPTGRSMAANHCGRLSRITGALERQEWASEMVMRLRASSAPTSMPACR